MTDITIPAAARRVGRDLLSGYFPDAGSVLRAEVAEELCLAMLAAWPGMERHTFPESGSGDDYTPPIDEIFLPLPPQENPDVDA